MHGKRLVFLGFFMFVFPALCFAAPIPLFDSWPNYLSERKPTALYSVDIDQDGDLDLVVCHVQGGVNGPSVIIFVNNGAGVFSRDTTLHLLGGPVAVVAKDVERDGDVDIVTCNENTNNITIFKNRGFGRGFGEPLNCPVGRTPKSLVVDSLNIDNVAPGLAQFVDVATANFTVGTASLLFNHGAAAFPVESLKVLGIRPGSLAAFDMDNDGDRDLAASLWAFVPPGGSTDPVLGANGLLVIRNLAGFFDDSNRVFFKIPKANSTLSDEFFNPRQVIAGDFNGDGFADLALADSADPKEPSPRPFVCIFINRWPTKGGLNDSTFALPAPTDTLRARLRVGAGCRSIFAADLDGDGDLDIAAANSVSGTVSILKNNGGGSFAPKRDFLTPAAPYWIDGGDYDQDGDVDLAVVSLTGHSLAVLRNRGDGRFEVGTEYSSGSGSDPLHIVAADFNADGNTDLAIASQRRNQISVHLNNGIPNSTFAPAAFYGGGNFRGVAAADLDADGDFDLAAANQANGSVGVAIFRNNGNGTFAAQMNYSTINRAYSIVARDFDRDGDSDLAVCSEDVNQITILKNNGNATFASPVLYNAGSRPTFITSADVDRDGDWDLVTADAGVTSSLPDSLSVYFNDGSGAFPTRNSYRVGHSPRSVVAADWNGDGNVDLAASVAGTPESTESVVAVLMNNGSGTFAPAVRYNPGARPVALFAADMDQDGDKDIIVADNAINSVSFLENLGNGTFAPSVEYGAGFAPLSLTAADLDNDGDFDLAVTNDSAVFNSSHGAITILKNLTNSSCFMRGDLNGDGLHTVVDITMEINCIFPAIGICSLCVTDTNCDSALSAGDIIVLVRKVFAGVPLPPCP